MSDEAGQAQRYDEVVYPQLVYHWSHPRSVGAMAALFGIDPAPPERCRVLGIGCGTGANLLSMAFEHPGSEFVGVDVSPRQIEIGKTHAAALGLSNATLVAGSVGDLPASIGTFDYVLAQGVYTWVAPETRDVILRSARRLLKPEGVFYVSYNCHPGWHLANVVRELLLRRTDPSAPTVERVQQGREVLRAMHAASDTTSLVSAAMGLELEFIESMGDEYLAHDHFEPTMEAVYFEDFVGHADRCGLQYVANARPERQLASTQAPSVRAAMEAAPDRLTQQQILDHLLGTRFRRSLLCRADRPPVGSKPAADVLPRLHARLLRGDAVRRDGEGLVLELGESRRIRLPPGLLADWLVDLQRRWPSSVALRDRLDEAGPARVAAADALVRLFFAGGVELLLSPVSAASELTARPLGAECARIQAGFGRWVCSRVHRSEGLGPGEAEVLRALDGTRTTAEVARLLGARPADVKRAARGFLERCLLVAPPPTAPRHLDDSGG